MTTAGVVVVSGMICARPRQGGATWAVLQFVLGLRRLGWRVHFVEALDRASVIPGGATLEQSDNAAYLADTMSAFGLDGAWTLLERDGRSSVGMPRARLERLCSGADLLLNISGSLTDPELLSGPAVRVYVDLDPAFTQLWHEVQGIDMGLSRHDRFVTVGQAIGKPGCPIPTCGRDWIGIPPPVVLEHWPASTSPARPAMTTVGHWRGYGSIEHGGIHYGQRAHTLRRLMQLPSLTDQRFQLALAIHPDERADIEALAENGWHTIDPQSVAFDPWSYRGFVGASRAELGIPKSGYVESGSAWFSDRSACYLASGRPVITASTGFERYLPVGDGLLSFRAVNDAAECVAAVNADYARHSAAARRLAEEHLDSDRVLPRMLEAIGSPVALRC
jgi:hypothetical protein